MGQTISSEYCNQWAFWVFSVQGGEGAMKGMGGLSWTLNAEHWTLALPESLKFLTRINRKSAYPSSLSKIPPPFWRERGIWWVTILLTILGNCKGGVFQKWGEKKKGRASQKLCLSLRVWLIVNYPTCPIIKVMLIVNYPTGLLL